ncbi:hypothetical protein JAO73_12575 [Hymenobacter sp. BT523]|uniref:hypothetical protein n=1 Tax=Hymenobacter sp. BT523 TaxID=2795725 RepID=UPI0018EC0AC9|nr:hypothetical protein [Hymenobacter sp. BT523]MBJ6109849.1 hypothetical protein [Hymenobacter sp. BT523]
MTNVSRVMRWWNRIRLHPALAAVAIILLVYLYYLPTTPYQRQYFDADGYWQMGKEFYTTGKFALLSYANISRGYLLPVLLAPFTQLVESHNWSPLEVTHRLGAAVAALLFGWAGPSLWQALRGGPPVSLSRRLIFAGLGFLIWRDYFVFSLTDFPALLALVASLLALLRGRGLVSALLAGVAMAAATNFRPVYQAALPAVAVLALLPPPARSRWMGLARGMALVLGASLVLVPQLRINNHLAGVRSPWVLTNRPDEPNLFLRQLVWGLQMQKYETSIAGDYPKAQMVFENKRGIELFNSTGLEQFADVGQYVRMCAGQPMQAASVFIRHLFNGLDVQYPTPYITEVFVPTWRLALLNYSLIWGGLVVLLWHRWSRPTVRWVRPSAVLMALLLPCLTALVTAIECRFLLPLHLLLSGAVAFGASPVIAWRNSSFGSRMALSMSYLLVIIGFFSASISVQKHLVDSPRLIMYDLPIRFIKPAEPW